MWFSSKTYRPSFYCWKKKKQANKWQKQRNKSRCCVCRAQLHGRLAGRPPGNNNQPSCLGEQHGLVQTRSKDPCPALPLTLWLLIGWLNSSEFLILADIASIIFWIHTNISTRMRGKKCSEINFFSSISLYQQKSTFWIASYQCLVTVIFCGLQVKYIDTFQICFCLSMFWVFWVAITDVTLA